METEWKANTGRFSLLKRKVATLNTARRVHRSVERLKKDLQKRPELDEEAQKQQWDDLHRKNARMACSHIRKYRGFLTKVGQAASTKAGDIPAPWVEELTPLQDQLPVSPFKEVRRTIRADLGCPLEEIFSEFDEKPIASASVAQVHVARLKSDGRKVCVKVQHHGVEKVMDTDLATIEFILRKAARYHPEIPDFTSLIREWRRASREEVDFVLEAQYAMRAEQALKLAGVDVACPKPVPKYSSRRVLTMEFVDGWKITEVEQWPPTIDRQDTAEKLVNAFAMLTFQEGLIHGDPHPGNVFVELLPAEPAGNSARGSRRTRARPVLLDWGLVQQVETKGRVAMARWAVATLSQDRALYVSSLRDLGFGLTADFEEVDLDDWMDAFAWNFRDSISTARQQQFNDHYKQREESSTGERKTVESVPGTVLFFLRGLKMLQDICGRLDVVVPFAQVMLQHALPLLEAPGTPLPAKPLPAPLRGDGRECPPVELAVRAKLEELRAAGSMLGAQVAVMDDDSTWQCSVAVGRAGILGAPVDESTLMPLLDVGSGVLAACVRRVCANNHIHLESAVSAFWPDFGSRGKKMVTIQQLLEGCGGLASAFPGDLTLKSYCSEQAMEAAVAKCPHTEPNGRAGNDSPDVTGTALASLLRRLLHQRNVTGALKTCLHNLGLYNDIVYFGPDNRMAYLGRKPMGQLSLARIVAWLEERERQKQLLQDSRQPQERWRTWEEFAIAQPGCADPILINREELRCGKGCAAGRGLRASAKALCRLQASTAELEAPVPTSARDGKGAARNVQGQLFRFRLRGRSRRPSHAADAEDGGEVAVADVGYGCIDPHTGSIVLRLPSRRINIAILLNAVDESTRHVGEDVLAAVVGCWGLAPIWPSRSEDGAPLSARRQKQRTLQPQAALDAGEAASDLLRGPGGLSGSWASAQIVGLAELLQKFEIPAVTRQLIKQMSTELTFDFSGPAGTAAAGAPTTLSLTMEWSLAGHAVDAQTDAFTVGEPFRGDQWGANFRGLGTWTASSQPGRNGTLKVEKCFEHPQGVMVMEEVFEVQTSGRLAQKLVLKGAGPFDMPLYTSEELERLCNNVHESETSQGGPQVLRLTRDFNVGASGQHLPSKLKKGGLVVAVPRPGNSSARPAGPPLSLSALRAMALPSAVRVMYEDTECVVWYDRILSESELAAAKPVATSAGEPSRGVPQPRGTAGAASSGADLPLATNGAVAGDGTAAAVGDCLGACGKVCATGLVATAQVLGRALLMLGGVVVAMCTEAMASNPTAPTQRPHRARRPAAQPQKVEETVWWT